MSKRACVLVLGITVTTLRLGAQTPDSESRSQANRCAKEIFHAPLANPSEPANMFRYAGDGQVDFGLTQPFTLYTLEGKTTSWQVGLRPAIASRFQVRDPQLLLKAADLHLGIPVTVRKGKWAARVELFHLSSHRGADFAASRAAPNFTYSREVVQVLLAYGDPDRWRLYAGPAVTLHTRSSGLGRLSFQAGSEWFPKSLVRPHWRFYFAEDFATQQETGWRVNYSVQPGALFTTHGGEHVARLGAWFSSGQTPFGQFFRERETLGGV